MLQRGALIRGTLYGLFALSGLAGLMYESIWTHYLKLFLGHAAYAQTLVLAIFMGGMAIGAWLAGDIAKRAARPLLWYVGVECLLGLAALLFDRSFRGMQGWMYDLVLPQLGSPFAVDLVKWTAAALIILPQSILLGATFPLMSAGVVRIYPKIAGSTLSWLYFSNSFGASAGVLLSGFVLVDKVGLPGTMLTAGLINFLLAFGVYVVNKGLVESGATVHQQSKVSGMSVSVTVSLLLITAFVTGAASFLYEIGWIRMLSLVLGSATHSFELMLSAFIVGLAIGSFWIRKRIDGRADLVQWLGWIQVTMAMLALLSLPLYMQGFDAMAAFLSAVNSNASGYVLFNLYSYSICFALMLPVTICAGMTLPIITTIMLRQGYGEQSIGRVYAANTLGAITGVILAVHLVMPLMGLRQVVIVGALFDFGLGIWLLFGPWSERLQLRLRLALAAMVVAALTIAVTVEFDPNRTASGVFRKGASRIDGEVLFHRDGKTATVDVIRDIKMNLSIATNGKVDAGFEAEVVSGDDYTMILMGAIPLAHVPNARQAAIIGLGSGRSTHTMLSGSSLERVDTVEIEPAMVEGARLFGPLVSKAYEDPRSHIEIDDAKTFFSRTGRHYDVISSEPSNPWVSGVASLFTIEFYQHVKRHLRPGGVFVQWLHLYEIDIPMISTVMNALGASFDDYAVYLSNDVDVVIAAMPSGALPSLSGRVLQDKSLAELLASLDIRTMDDLNVRKLGTKKTLAPYFSSLGMPANSDYFPILDQGATSRRFMKLSAAELASLHGYSSRLEDLPLARVTSPKPESRGSVYSLRMTNDAASIDAYWLEGVTSGLDGVRELPQNLLEMFTTLKLISGDCDAAVLRRVWSNAVKAFTMQYSAYISPEAGRLIAETVRTGRCYAGIEAESVLWIDFLESASERDWSGSLAIASRMLQSKTLSSSERSFLMAEQWLAALKAGMPREAAEKVIVALGGPLNTLPLAYLSANWNASRAAGIGAGRKPAAASKVASESLDAVKE